MKGISIKSYIGLGDGLQFSSLPENYFRATGEKLVDVSKPWFFDHNPFVVRDVEAESVVEMWNFPKIYDWPKPRQSVYMSNAEVWASVLQIPVVLNRPRLYRFEDVPFKERETILLQTVGRSNGSLPEHIIEHVIKKYKDVGLVHIGLETEPDLGLPRIITPTLWELAEVVSKARMVIGPDSGPGWVAACYPDVQIKKVRLRMPHGFPALQDWVPLEIENHHSHWDDRAFQTYNPGEDDVGFTMSYKRI